MRFFINLKTKILLTSVFVRFYIQAVLTLKNALNNYIPIYWVMGALFKRAMSHCLDGSIDKKTKRIAHKEAKNIAWFIPWWF